MNELHRVIRDAIYVVAPDVDTAGISADVDFREAAGLDSMDLLNVLTELARITGVEVPEAEYASVTTIDDLAAYVAAHQPA